ncbi:hypothetical protein J2Y45_002147 [Dyadobacter sp. BE34]|uniref:KilA-N domain-containing protein n=1 Tax=Dyadobacter fermentans TaxID=94254 RepID=A0ABU1QWK8_9BACT|nr:MULTISPECIES: hypothetical protein [Dyadobacter]MDR6805544.1 hypothetical protein [Dyadobacter fermentans]MDR7042696.1 hypothetical protein [Dyadobacter sp. BE242]MDR7197008.1 hypothetical protein [Dyadobacter sp. BE34]MDR7215557.1 hypothetical protein [Dyadobacter sp. BE31]MDR7263093.1 hypothetical protein [Dyadobacter sp. BE32]
MKTNVTLVSQSRELFGITIRQETQTGHLNLSDLQRAYDLARKIHGWSDRSIDKVLESKQNHERIYYILEKNVFNKVLDSEVVIKPGIRGFIEHVERQGITKVLKSYGAYSTKGARHTKSTWCNPYIWVLIAMEMNPMLYGNVITWLTDGLILNRIEAGNMFKDLAKGVAKFPDTDYANLARALNHIVFGRHESGIRNTGTEQQLRELERLETNLAFSIDSGFIKSFSQLMDHLRQLWSKKYPLIAS